MPVHVEVGLVRLALGLSSEDGFFRNVTPRSCGPAVTGMRAFRCASTRRVGLAPRGGFTVNSATRSRSSSTSSSCGSRRPSTCSLRSRVSRTWISYSPSCGKRVGDQRPAARAERQPLDVLLLREVRPDAERVAAGAVRRSPTASRLIFCAAVM